MKIELSEKLELYSKNNKKNKILLYLGKDACCGIAVPRFFAKFIKEELDLKYQEYNGIKIFYEPYIENFLEDKDINLDLIKLLNIIIVNY